MKQTTVQSRVVHLVFSLVLLLVTVPSIGQIAEICDDALDNDGDGLIDLNDDDCVCLTSIPSGLIPNPSFENFIQCPRFENNLDGFAQDWIQASAATSDFVHTCGGFLGNPFANGAEAPLPFPDGEGAIGFRDGNTGRSNFKEYVGARLISPMKAGTEYKLDFYVGFHDHFSSLEFPMAVFFTADANNLPFGGNNTQIGCPTNTPGWVEVGDTTISGRNEWVRVEFEFTPEEDFEAIVLGPGCAVNPLWADEPYFWADRLALAEKSEFSIPTNILGDICDDELLIELLPDQDGYQWYFEGVALVGETDQVLNLDSNSQEGTYVAVVQTPNGCFLSEEYFLAFPPQRNFEQRAICEGETLELGTQLLTQPGTYEELFVVGSVCDSLVILDLEVFQHTEGSTELTFCTGQTVFVEGEAFEKGGDYERLLTGRNFNGCDSTLRIKLIEVDTTVEYFSQIEICEGDEVSFGMFTVSDAGVYPQRFAIDTGCDSTSVVEVIVNRDSESLVIDTICPDQSVEIAAQVYDTPGMYQTVISNISGCDSVVNIEIIGEPFAEEVRIVDTIAIQLGELFDLSPTLSADVDNVEWYRNGEFISNDFVLDSVFIANSTTYELFAYTEFGCLTTRSIEIDVDRSYNIYIPNIISKIGGLNNDKFLIGYDVAVQDIRDMRIYDRWGELVYVYQGSLAEYTGWDGRFRSDYVEQGVYAYVIDFGLVDGTPVQRAGTFTYLD